MHKVMHINPDEYFRLKDGAKMYSMSENTFAKLAKESGARYEVGTRMVLINKKLFEEYLQSFRNK